MLELLLQGTQVKYPAVSYIIDFSLIQPDPTFKIFTGCFTLHTSLDEYVFEMAINNEKKVAILTNFSNPLVSYAKEYTRSKTTKFE